MSHLVPRTATTPSSECSMPSPRYSLPDSMDNLGANYFISTVITPRTEGSSRGYYEYIPDLFLREQNSEAMLSAVSAVGLAAMSNINHSPKWLHHSQAQYANAVKLVNRSLQSAEEARRDSTLVAVSVLCLYDQIAHNSDSRLDTWAHHAKGAASILAVRGVDQMTTPLGIRMFSQVMADMLLACLHQRLSMPIHMVVLREVLTHSGYVDPNHLAWQLNGVGIECLNLLATCQSLPLVVLMDQALRIDKQFQRLLDSLLSQGHYITIHDSTADPSQVYNQRFDIYREPQSVKIWDGGRAFRSLLHQTLQERLVQAFADRPSEVVHPRFTQQLQSSLEIMLQMRDDILASMPQLLGQLPPINLETVPFPTEDMAIFTNARVPGGSHLPVWFLYVIAQSPVARKSDRKWILNQMDAIWREKGIFIAWDLAGKIKKLASGISKVSD
ncbi:uncharacterized protein N7484_010067 [Penicillium longicatenatum]|uniref:uncharacterized protein n=1 Tax=Penicillium longicatenatum TaxID=1561947 RepID=UPI00254899B0|nr:uncharacterized protein N7484_010067 [Penicillium longicatenatum]KAJ5636754.1 hypothetical protein N7484_010067 [Penicillium longicatenatum]